MAAAHPCQPWHIMGKRGSVVYDSDSSSWKARYFAEEALTDIEIESGPAAPNRKYGSGEKIPWQEKTFPIADFHAIDFYDKCHEYYARNKEPFVPASETRELMRVIDECRKDARKAPAL